MQTEDGEPTLQGVARRLDRHLSECAAEGRETNASLAELKTGHADILRKLDGLNKAGWSIVGAAGLAVFVWLLTNLHLAVHP